MTKLELKNQLDAMTNNLSACMEKIGETNLVLEQLDTDLKVALRLIRLREVVNTVDTGEVRKHLDELFTCNLESTIEVARDLISEVKITNRNR